MSSKETFFIRSDYVKRQEVVYFDDIDISFVVYQPDVYKCAEVLSKRLKCNTIIDVGCGNGHKLAQLDIEVKIGIDYGPNLISAREKLPSIMWFEADFETVSDIKDVENYVDNAIVICADVVEHLNDPTNLLRLLKKFSSRASVVIISTPDRIRNRGDSDLGPPKNPSHIREWSFGEFEDYLVYECLNPTLYGYTIDSNFNRSRSTLVALISGKLTTLLSHTAFQVETLSGSIYDVMGSNGDSGYFVNIESGGLFSPFADTRTVYELKKISKFSWTEQIYGSWVVDLEGLSDIHIPSNIIASFLIAAEKAYFNCIEIVFIDLKFEPSTSVSIGILTPQKPRMLFNRISIGGQEHKFPFRLPIFCGYIPSDEKSARHVNAYLKNHILEVFVGLNYDYQILDSFVKDLKFEVGNLHQENKENALIAACAEQVSVGLAAEERHYQLFEEHCAIQTKYKMATEKIDNLVDENRNMLIRLLASEREVTRRIEEINALESKKRHILLQKEFLEEHVQSILNRLKDTLCVTQITGNDIWDLEMLTTVTITKLKKTPSYIMKHFVQKQREKFSSIFHRLNRSTRATSFLGKAFLLNKIKKPSSSNDAASGRVVIHNPVYHNIFDPYWYKVNYLDNSFNASDPLTHYVQQGWRDGKNPFYLFNTEWYLANNFDVKAAGIEPFSHFLTWGAYEDRSPHPLFDSKYYFSKYPDVADAGMSAFFHYIFYGWREDRKPNALFDPQYYKIKYNLDCAQNPLQHYIDIGWKRGYSPCFHFNSEWYLTENPDVVALCMEPLSHYIVTGSIEGRNPNPVFDVSWYRHLYGKEIAGIEPLSHYVEFGFRELREPNPIFDPYWYSKAHRTECVDWIDPLQDYVENQRWLDSWPLNFSAYLLISLAENKENLNAREFLDVFDKLTLKGHQR